jgi:hypothetical protein
MPDSRLQRGVCPLCDIREACVETAVVTPTDNTAMRRIMAIELASFGSRPDHMIYRDIAHAYNTEIRAPMLQANLACVSWSIEQVREHFEQHVDLVPRRLVARQIRRLERLSSLVDNEVSNAEQQRTEDDESEAPAATELIDTKIVKKQIDLAKATAALVKEYRCFQQEDQAACGVDSILRSVQLGQTSAQEAQKMLETAAMARCAYGAVEMPRASELFE